MSWSEKTWFAGGGDTPFRMERHYRYRFCENKWSRFKFYKAKIIVPFDNYVEGGDGYSLNGDITGHQYELAIAPFKVRNHNVMEWVREVVTTGRAELRFEIERVDWIARTNKTTLYAKFSDKGIASLFKLTFGGK